jgi:hypothetical protein
VAVATHVFNAQPLTIPSKATSQDMVASGPPTRGGKPTLLQRPTSKSVPGAMVNGVRGASSSLPSSLELKEATHNKSASRRLEEESLPAHAAAVADTW